MSEMSTTWAAECDFAPIAAAILKNLFELILNDFMERWTNVFDESEVFPHFLVHQHSKFIVPSCVHRLLARTDNSNPSTFMSKT